MDRPLAFGSGRVFGGLVLASVVLSAGCRSTHSEVPAAKPYARTGDQLPSVGFSSEPRPPAGGPMLDSINVGPGGMIDDQLAGAASNASVYGTPTAGDKLAMPTANLYGRPGSSGTDPTAGAGTSDLGDALMRSEESVVDSLKRDPNLQRTAESPQ